MTPLRRREHRVKVNDLTETIIGAGMEVHRILGPGRPESAHEACPCRELESRGNLFRRQVPLPVSDKSVAVERVGRLDPMVEEDVIVEVKAVEQVLPIHEAQHLTCLRLADQRVGLLINFHAPLLKQGIRRMVHQLAATSAPSAAQR